MKRSRLSYDEWKCILEKKQGIGKFENDTLVGHAALLEIAKVTAPQIWKFNGEDIVVCQKGYRWLSILPKKECYCITAMMDEKEKILLWYIDMIAAQGIDSDGVPYFDDLYLDLVVYPDGTILEDDRDELEEALLRGDITKEQFVLADTTCRRLKEKLADTKAFVEYTYACLELMKKDRESKCRGERR